MSDFFDVSDLGGLSDADFTTDVNKTNSLVSCFSLITKIHIRKRARSLRISDRCKIISDKRGEPSGTIGEEGVFVLNGEDVDKMIDEANGDISTYEKELGFDEGHFADGGGMVRIDVKSPMDLNARVPSGNEMGANDHFVPGGYTDGGAPECVTDNIPNDDTYRKISFFN